MKFTTKLIFVPLFALCMTIALTWMNQDEGIVSANSILTVEPTTAPTFDLYGNVVEQANQKFNYLIKGEEFYKVEVNSGFASLNSQKLNSNPFVSSPHQVTPPIKPMPFVNEPIPNYLDLKWQTGLWGAGIGASGITAEDIDEDGVQEIILGGGFGFSDNTFWYIVSISSNGGYQQEWLSPLYPTPIQKIRTAYLPSQDRYLIFVAVSNGTIEVYDGQTRELITIINSGVSTLSDIAIGDLDNDNTLELVVVSSNKIAVFDATTYALEWQTTSYNGLKVEIGNVDEDLANEIVTTHYVVDGVTHLSEWFYPDTFGVILQLADVDNDNMKEIIAAESWYQINAFDANTEVAKWDFPTSHDIGSLYVSDIDNDGVQEIVYGDGQWGAIHVINSLTLTQEWFINNPEHGVTNIGFSDVDDDNQVELLWGAGASSTGSDHLFIANTTTRLIEWQNLDITGPLSAVDVGDVDHDGVNEIVMVSYKSDSGYSSGIIFVYNAETYELEWQSEPILNGQTWPGIKDITLANIDNDPALEILIATAQVYDGLIIAYDGLTHEVDWQTPKYNGTHFSSLAVADIDNDGQIEVIGGQGREHTGAPGVYVYVFNGDTGAEEWHTVNLTYWGYVYDILTGDFDEDGNPDILFSVSDGYVYLYDGVTKTQKWVSTLTSATTLAVTDIDQNGNTEFLIGTWNGQIKAYNSQTYALEWSETLSNQPIYSLQLADVDENDEFELVVTTNGYLWVYDPLTFELIWQSPFFGNATGYKGHVVVRNIDDDLVNEVVFGGDYAFYVFTYAYRPFLFSLAVDQPLATQEDLLEYTIQISNLSNHETLPVELTDTIPTHTTYEPDSLWASTGDWEIDGNVITWTTELIPNAVISLTFAVTVDSDTPNNSQITNTAFYTIAQSANTQTVQTIIDTLPPASTIVQPISSQLLTGTVYTITGTAMDNLATVDYVEIRINGGDWQMVEGSTKWFYTWTLPITDATFLIESRATDTLGLTETPTDGTLVIVDKLSPFVISTSPAHGSTNIPLNSPLVIEFSEPILPETLTLNCQPIMQEVVVSWQQENKVAVFSHTELIPNQMYSCVIENELTDQAGHSLIAGPVANPWGFSTGSLSLTQSVYLPLIVK